MNITITTKIPKAMNKMKGRFNLDRCELFGITPLELANIVAAVSVGDVIERDGYYLRAVATDGLADTDTNTNVTFEIVVQGVPTLGDVTFKNSRQYCGVWTMRIYNKVFYTSTMLPNERYSDFSFVPLIIDDLHLNLRTVTKLEVALDVNVNAGKRIRRIRKDTEKYDVIKNGRKVSDTERLGMFIGTYSRTKTDLTNASDYVENAKGLSIKTYYKNDEINENGKQYIGDWNGWNGKIWRSEIATKSEDVKDWLQYCHTSKDSMLYTSCITHFLHRLSDEEYLMKFWRWQSHRLLRFNRSCDDKKIDLLDAICGNV